MLEVFENGVYVLLYRAMLVFIFTIYLKNNIKSFLAKV